jgi:hypothetical protein
MGNIIPKNVKITTQKFLIWLFFASLFFSPDAQAFSFLKKIENAVFGAPIPVRQKTSRSNKPQNNTKKYFIKYNDYSLGQVTLNHQNLNNYISVTEIFDRLHIKIKQTSMLGIFVVEMPSGKNFTIDFYKKKISSPENIKNLNQLEYKIIENNYYLEVNTLAALFDIKLEIYQESNEVKVKTSDATKLLVSFISGDKTQLIKKEIITSEEPKKQATINESAENFYGPPIAEKPKSNTSNSDMELSELPENSNENALLEKQFSDDISNPTPADSETVSSEEQEVVEAAPLEALQDGANQDETNQDMEISEMPKTEKESREIQNKNFSPVTDYTEDNLLVYEIRIGELSYDSLVDVYDHPITDNNEDKSAYYVSLKQLCKAVDFPITIKMDEGKAFGWFIKEENKFEFDFKNKKLLIAEKEIPIAAQDFFTTKNEVFILAQNIKTWFPIDYELKYNSQILILNPRVLLPFQEEELRRVKRSSQLNQTNKNDYPFIEEPYKLYQIPEADVTLTFEGAGSKNSSPKMANGFSSLLTGDAAGFSTKTLISGNDEQINSLRIRAERKDYKQNILDSGISEISFGDISSTPINLVSGSETGTGVAISTYPITSSNQFDKTVIEGDAKPGWEAELYRNGQILTFQSVGPDGRYKFENVDVLYGENIFKIILYGPQGEVREEERKVYIGDNILKKGDSNFRFSANQKNTTFAGIESVTQPALNRFVAQGEYGFTNNLTLASAFVTDEIINKATGQKEYNYFQQFDFSTEILDTFQNFNMAYNYTGGGQALRHTIVTRAKETSINFTQEYYSGFENYNNSSNPDPIEYNADFSLNRSVSLPVINSANIGLDANYAILESGEAQPSFGTGFATTINGFGFNNRVDVTLPENNDEQINGLFSMRTNAAAGYLKFDTRYRFSPTSDIDSVNISYLRIFSEKTSLRLDLNQQITGEPKTDVGASFNFYTKNYLLGLTASIDSEMEYRIGASISFSLYKDPVGDFNMSSDEPALSGSAKTFAFLDENYNGKFDEKENIIKSAEFDKGGTPLRKIGDKYSYVRNLPEFQSSEIKFVSGSLDDPLWYPSVEGYNVIGRAGVTTEVAFPVIRTYELDGSVYLKDSGGDVNSGPETVSGLTIYLLDEKSKRVAEVTSEFDGYFMFEKIKPGKYFLVVSDEQLKPLDLKQESIPEVNITKDQDFYSNNNIHLLNLNSISITVEDGTSNSDLETSTNPEDFVGPQPIAICFKPANDSKFIGPKAAVYCPIIIDKDKFIGPPLPTKFGK